MKSLSSILIFLIIGISTANAEIQFKTERIQLEFNELNDKNYQLYKTIYLADIYLKERFNKNIIITEIYRTQKEQKRYYKGKRQFRSPHQDWLAVDLRTRHLTECEIKELVDIINKERNFMNTYIPTAFYHDIGLGKHIHIQFKERK